MDNRQKKIIKSSTGLSIRKLVDQARHFHTNGQAERSKRYIKMTMDLLKKNKVKLPIDLKNSFCKKCFVIWIPGQTVIIAYDKKNDCLRLSCKCGNSKRI